jgi:hypothetical protein
MTHGIPTGPIPPARGLEREEPELNNEADIPSDDDGPAAADPPAGERQGEPRRRERE